MATIQEEMSGNVGGEQGSPTGNSDLVEVLRRENEHLRNEVAWLRSRVDQLTPLMLPKRKGLFAWLRPRSVTGASQLSPLAAFSVDLVRLFRVYGD